MIYLKINGISHAVDIEADMPLLWVLRDILGLVGTQYGCGIGQCGACTVIVDGQAERACQLAVGDVAGDIITIEGLGAEAIHPVQEAWIAAQAAQCGYCQSGQIMTAAAFYDQFPQADLEAFQDALAGNLCRCASYVQIQDALTRLIAAREEGN